MQQFPYIAEIFVLGGIASAAVIAADLRTCRQPMRIMHSVWILTGLWASFFGLWAYFAFGRARGCQLEEKAQTDSEAAQKKPHDGKAAGEGSKKRAAGERAAEGVSTGNMPGRADMRHAGMQMPGGHASMEGMQMPGGHASMEGMQMPAGHAAMEGMQMPAGNAAMAGMQMPDGHASMAGMQMPDGHAAMEGMQMPMRPKWQSVVLSTLHCGAGCTLADLIGEWFLFFVPIAIGGSLIAGSWVVDYLLALLIGIGFQYAAIRGMEPSTPGSRIIRRAAKADILSLTAWQAGMYGWMAVVIFALNGGMTLPRTSFAFWFMMQIAMACGFLVALPMNVLLIRLGIKKGM